MNIGFDAKRAFYNRSGLGNYSRSTIRLLSHYFPDNSYYLFSGKPGTGLVQQEENQSIVRPDNQISALFPGYWRSWDIHHQISQHKLDVYHGLSNELPLSQKKTNAKSVVTIHDLIFLRFPEYYPLIDRQIYSFKFKHACRVADKIIATSIATKADIVSFFGTDPLKIEVVYQSCDPVFSSKLSSERKAEVRKEYDLPEQFILYLGTIEKRKNALSLVKAFINENIDFPLVIAGKPTTYITEIKEFLSKNAAGNRVIFRHNIRSNDLPALYQSAIIFVYPSIFEGFGIPILEALNSGVPVITSTGSCFAETGGDAAMYCDPYDIEQIGNTINMLLHNSGTRQSMIEKGFAHARKFEEDKVAVHLMKTYSDLI
jgi:glycosyltransferase involved in cell wall biosynthesis